ncbi:hypothetical protein UFOVP190_93 [uncultured Caudovirales phage]|uniref:Uncharacterized protein n=1 Tax=uncultured Caudovirales phage TaxID=2100421 RepID=A0A6J7WNW5_9CAUD|nr:hypothetical protein UFOVP190_93 [uncultured Caudovirales phage]
MASTINADNGILSGISGIIQTGDATGNLSLQAVGNTVVTFYANLNSVYTGNVTAPNVVVSTGIFFSNGMAFSSGSTASLLENVKTASYTLALADTGKVVAFDTATDCTVTVPSDATVNFPTGSLVYIFRANTGNVTLANAAGVSLTKTGKFGTYEQIYLRKRAANVWVTVEESGISNGSFSNVNTNGSTTINGIYTIQTWTSSSGNFTISG